MNDILSHVPDHRLHLIVLSVQVFDLAARIGNGPPRRFGFNLLHPGIRAESGSFFFSSVILLPLLVNARLSCTQVSSAQSLSASKLKDHAVRGFQTGQSRVEADEHDGHDPRRVFGRRYWVMSPKGVGNFGQIPLLMFDL